MLQLRGAKVWMLADGRPESQGRCPEYSGLHQGVFYWMMNGLILIYSSSVDLCKCWTSSVSLQISGAQCAGLDPACI